MAETRYRREWVNWKASKPPFVLDSDRPMLDSERNAKQTITICSWRQAYLAKDFCGPKDSRLHLGLLPQPFLGDLNRASIFILGLNPGLGAGDYYAEYEVAKFRRALRANLEQKFRRGSLPFLFLDPQYAWHGGFAWWHRKLAGVISCLSKTWEVDFAKARERLAGKLVSVELVPYHSSELASRWFRLESISLVRSFVANEVVGRVRTGKAIAIAIRQARIWGLPKQNGFVSYTPLEARAASLSPDSRGGRAILRHLRSA
jgi:hypothetical protein